MTQYTVIQVIADLGDGGVETMLMDIYRNIDRDVFKFVFVVQTASRKFSEEIYHLGGEIIEISPLKSVGVKQYINSIIDICKSKNASILHCHNLTQNGIILYAAKKAGIKIRISHSHLTTAFSRKTKILMPFIRCAINHLSTHRFACGKQAGEFLYGKKDFIIINNAIDVDKFSAALLADINRIIPQSDGKHVLLHIGRLSGQKNHAYLIHLMSLLKSYDPDFILLCCGSGPEYEKVDKLIKENALEGNVFLLGSRSDVPSLIKRADLLLLPSLYEGFPVTVIEAQAAGIRSIISDTIDHSCDLRVGLVDFLPITDEACSRWIDLITKKLDVTYVKPDCSAVLRSNGFDSKTNAAKVEMLYKNALADAME